MNENIEKLIKISGILNKSKFHLHINTDLEEKYEWVLYLVFEDSKQYFSSENKAIMSSSVDSIEDLINYLENHNGFSRRW